MKFENEVNQQIVIPKKYKVTQQNLNLMRKRTGISVAGSSRGSGSKDSKTRRKSLELAVPEPMPKVK